MEIAGINDAVPINLSLSYAAFFFHVRLISRWTKGMHKADQQDATTICAFANCCINIRKWQSKTIDSVLASLVPVKLLCMVRGWVVMVSILQGTRRHNSSNCLNIDGLWSWIHFIYWT